MNELWIATILRVFPKIEDGERVARSRRMASAKTKDSKTVPWYRLPREWLKDGATRYIDFNEQLADRLFEQGRRMAATVEQTPVYPLIEFQQTFSRKAFEYYVKGARLLIERL